MCSVIIGFLHSIGAFFLKQWLKYFSSRRNWQFKKATKAYEKLFVAGREEIMLLGRISNVAEVCEGYQKDEIWPLRKRLKGTIDSAFLQIIRECWLLEKESCLRDSLKEIRKGYNQYREHVTEKADALCEHDLQKTGEMLLRKTENRIYEYKGPSANNLFAQLDNLREDVAKKYFH